MSIQSLRLQGVQAVTRGSVCQGGDVSPTAASDGVGVGMGMDNEQRKALNEKEQKVSQRRRLRRWAELAETLAGDADRSGMLALTIGNPPVWDRVELACHSSGIREQI